MDFRVVNEESSYRGFFALNRYKVVHRLFSGAMSSEITRELLDRGNAVALLPYDPVTDTVLFVEQFRIGAKDDPAGAWLIEPIAGMIDLDEQPQEVAVREAQEEAGLSVSELIPIAEYYCSPGGCNEKVYLYCSRTDLSQTSHHAIHGLQAEGEDIRVHLVPAQELETMLAAGVFNTAMALIAVQWLVMNRSHLRDQWVNTREKVR